MAIDVNRISRVIIGGNWYTVDVGTFRVSELVFTDRDGNPLHEGGRVPSYEFWTIDRDFYTGPLSELQLVKLTPP